MPTGNTTANDLLKILLGGVDASWRTNPSRYLAWHTASPLVSGNQTSNEATYGGYARTAILVANWTDNGTQFANSALVQAPQCTSGSETLTHVSIGTLVSGAGQILAFGTLATSIAVSAPIQPQFAIAGITWTIT